VREAARFSSSSSRIARVFSATVPDLEAYSVLSAVSAS